MNTKPLEGVKVVELCTHVYGPACAAVLSGYGADVIKVEHPEGGDPLRFNVNRMTAAKGPGALVEFCNHGKRSVGLDLTEKAGLDAIKRLVADADVFVTNMLPGARKKLGIDVEDVKNVNPKAVYAIASAHGPSGPEATLGGFDIITAYFRGGTAGKLTKPGADAPVIQPPAFFDIPAGMMLAGGIGTALFHRERTGEGSVVDVSLLNVGMWSMAPDIIMSQWGDHEVIEGMFKRTSPDNPLSNSYRTKDDRWLMLSFLQSDKYWSEFCERIERPDLRDDPRFSDHLARGENSAELVVELDTTFGAHTLAEWGTKLDGIRGPWAPMASPMDVHQDRQALANGYLPEQTDRDGNQYKLVAPPVQFNSEAATPSGPAPEAGQQTEEVLLELGYSWEEIEAGKESGAFQ